jgi:putative transposase
MTLPANSNRLNDAMELLTTHGFSEMGQALAILLDTAMLIERERYLGAGHYERTDERQGYANGFKSKTMKTRVGALQLSVPQTRDSQFYPKSLEKGIRSERALKAALAEMYVNGVSTRKVANITEKLCGFEVSSEQVSRATKLLDEELQSWRTRRLGCFRYVFLDARYEKVRQGGHVLDAAVLIAIGVDKKGIRHILGVSVKLSEQEVHWRDFLKSLHERGLHGMLLITSDAHSGLKAALRAVFPTVPWQRCQFHLQQNAQSYVPKQEWKTEVARDIRHIFTAATLPESERLLGLSIERWTKRAPQLAAWMEENIREGLTVFQFPEEHRKRLRTSNVLERVNKEIKRRTRVACIFPNEASCLRLVTAILMEISEEWETGNKYLPMEEMDQNKTL